MHEWREHPDAAATAGNAVAVPQIVASANPAYAAAAPSATVLCAACVVVTAILAPFGTAFMARLARERELAHGVAPEAAQEVPPVADVVDELQHRGTNS